MLIGRFLVVCQCRSIEVKMTRYVFAFLHPHRVAAKKILAPLNAYAQKASSLRGYNGSVRMRRRFLMRIRSERREGMAAKFKQLFAEIFGFACFQVFLFALFGMGT